MRGPVTVRAHLRAAGKRRRARSAQTRAATVAVRAGAGARTQSRGSVSVFEARVQSQAEGPTGRYESRV